MIFPLNILLDSGAFSAFMRGIEIPLNDYIDYCKRHASKLSAYVNLDSIPGGDGKVDSSQKAIEWSAAKSHENQKIMKAAGLTPIAVFHQGERFYWLERMLEEGETYIGISPSPGAHPNEIVSWMDKAFSRCTDSNGLPIVKTHGFGVTSCNLCTRYPWTSVDSTSWSIGGGYGSILVPQYVAGKPDYSKPPLTLRISARKQDQSKGFDGLTEIEKDMVRQAAIDVGITMLELRNTFLGRWAFNINYYKGMAATCTGRPFANRAQTFFNKGNSKKGFQPKPLKMYFATVLSTLHHNEFLNEQEINNRLVSYAFLRDLPDDSLQRYIDTGLPDLKKARPRKLTQRMYESEVYRVRRAMALIRMSTRQDGEMV